MRRGYVVPMRWMVIYEYGVPGGGLNLNSTGCGRNSELVINKNNILLNVIDTSFITSQFTMVLNFFYIVSLFVCNVC
jgi:hypothetical protein